MPADRHMDAYLAVVSLRAVRKYLPEPLPDDVLTRILQAGRATGSASNGQYWRFYVIRQRAVLDQLAETVYEPDNLRGAPVALALVLTRPRSFDAGQIGLTDLLILRREILETRFQYLDALLEAALARIDLDASAAILR